MEITIPTWLIENWFLNIIYCFCIVSYLTSPRFIRKYVNEENPYNPDKKLHAAIYYIFSPIFMIFGILFIIIFKLLFLLEFLGKIIMKGK